MSELDKMREEAMRRGKELARVQAEAEKLHGTKGDAGLVDQIRKDAERMQAASARLHGGPPHIESIRDHKMEALYEIRGRLDRLEDLVGRVLQKLDEIAKK